MIDLYIIGAGDVGGYLAYHAKEMGDYNIVGFIDDDKEKHGKKLHGLCVLGGIDFLLNIKDKIAVAIAIANPKEKKKIVDRIKQSSLITFPNFIHSLSWIGENVLIGTGCIIYPGVAINYESILHDFVTINMNATVGHNCNLQSYSTISPGVNCGGFTVLGEESFMGIGCCTLQSCSIGEKVIIGAGAVVLKNIPDNVTVVGNPARKMNI